MKPIPDERFAASFTTRRIRTDSQEGLLERLMHELMEFVEEGDDMLVSRLTELQHDLHRASVLVLDAKKRVLLKKMEKIDSEKKKKAKKKNS